VDYIYDTNNADQAVAYLRRFLREIAGNDTFDSVTLVAHSMGSRVLTRAFAELAQEMPPVGMKKFSEIVLAAPDIDADVFRNDIAPALVVAGSPVTLYASSLDLAMVASQKLGGAPRAGDVRSGVIVVPGVESIDATKADTNLFWGTGHAYIADDSDMLMHLHDVAVDHLPAARRARLEQVSTAQGVYWRFK